MNQCSVREIAGHSVAAASRPAALLLPQILPVFSVVAPCRPGASTASVHQLFRGHYTSTMPSTQHPAPSHLAPSHPAPSRPAPSHPAPSTQHSAPPPGTEHPAPGTQHQLSVRRVELI